MVVASTTQHRKLTKLGQVSEQHGVLWPFAPEHYSFLHNVNEVGGESAYSLTQSEGFKGSSFRLGAI